MNVTCTASVLTSEYDESFDFIMPHEYMTEAAVPILDYQNNPWATGWPNPDQLGLTGQCFGNDSLGRGESTPVALSQVWMPNVAADLDTLVPAGTTICVL